MNPEKCCILIPSLSPDERLPQYVKALLESGFGGIIVVNDGSAREYDHFFDEIRQMERCTVLGYEVNQGKGYALRTGTQYFIEQTDFDGLITADSDGQHTPADTLKMAAAMDGSPKLWLGSRDFSKNNENIPPKSRFGNRTTSAVFKLLYGTYLPDTQTGLRAFTRELAPMILQVEGNRFEYEMNVLIRCSKEKVEMPIVPIDTIYLDENKSTHFHPIKDSWRIYKILLGEKMRPLVYTLASLLCWAIDYGIRCLLIYALFNHILEGQWNFWIFSFDIPVLAAYIPARIISSLINFKLNKTYAFEADGCKGAMLRYYCLVIFSLLLSQFISAWISSVLGAKWIWLIMLVVDAAIYVFNYYAQKLWVFRKDKNKNVEG